MPTKKFEKGQSGNPGGRPKRPVELVKACKEFNAEGLKILKSIARNKRGRGSDRVRSVELIFAYGNGRPKQGIELGGINGAPITHTEIDGKEALKDPRIREHLQQAALAFADGDAGSVRG